MKRAGISEAKNRLSALLDRVRHGEAVVIEDRGVPIARLEPMGSSPEHAAEGRLARLERLGVIRPPAARAPVKRLGRPRPRPAGDVRISDLVVEERRHDR